MIGNDDDAMFFDGEHLSFGRKAIALFAGQSVEAFFSEREMSRLRAFAVRNGRGNDFDNRVPITIYGVSYPGPRRRVGLFFDPADLPIELAHGAPDELQAHQIM